MAKHGSKRQFWSEAQARELLKAWRESGLSVAAFATQRGLRPERLHWWRNRLGMRPAPRGSSPREPSPLRLVPVIALPTPRPALVLRAGEAVALEFEDLARVDPIWLAGLLHALDGAPRC